MRITGYIILSLIISIPIYLLIINFLASGGTFKSIIPDNYSEILQKEVNVAVGDITDIKILRNRWYGKIEENLGENSISRKLYLFNLMPLQLQKGEKNYLTSHIIFFSFIFTVFLITIILEYVNQREKISN